MEKSLDEYDVQSLIQAIKDCESALGSHKTLESDLKMQKLELQNAVSSIEINTNKIVKIDETFNITTTTLKLMKISALLGRLDCHYKDSRN